MNAKERLIKVLKGEKVDRPPVICPGGMMNAAVTEVLEDISGNHNKDANPMAEAAKKVYDLTGFENYGVPFCLTVEAEPLGVEIDLGSKLVEPLVSKYNESSVKEIIEKYNIHTTSADRMPEVINAIKKLKNDEVPVIGNITGVFSTASSVIDPLKLLKMLRKDPKQAHEFLEFVNKYTIDYAECMIDAGADVIAVSDPTATGEILGTKSFNEFIVPLFKEFINRVHAKGVPVIVHICGNANNIIESLNEIGADALSFDSIVSMKVTRNIVKTGLMGNVSTHVLNFGSKEKIEGLTKTCINAGVNIVSPACGLGMSTPIENLKIMTDYVKKGQY